MGPQLAGGGDLGSEEEAVTGGIAGEGPQGELGGSIWEDVMFAAERLARLVDPQKVNYEIHGNTLPHLHAHVYARFRRDRFVGGPIDNRLEFVDNVPLDALREALA